ncbi:dynein light chain type 1 domain-containing protein [Purpureocillium lilacinum]|uniref:Dynein light chain type 1 domain-containing protein n=1 Tax=Purpureocillium lilacinum TaxID=33203 RepID=A0A179GE70_PURLI|nr:dynein light chain type 1 domain-containing protein [Purpureocillium lilacinum]OAQ76134.1 dynein light chain type 1 domain-containing protein [Purpureocillium lilacinum]OAQ83289.1 dynein light chain type 1 domain-containing protein [Purpureocillium lilacinum]
MAHPDENPFSNTRERQGTPTATMSEKQAETPSAPREKLEGKRRTCNKSRSKLVRLPGSMMNQPPREADETGQPRRPWPSSPSRRSYTPLLARVAESVPADRVNRTLLNTSSFDERKGPTWHCIVGRNFGSFVTRSTLSTSTSATAPSSSLRPSRAPTETNDAPDPRTTSHESSELFPADDMMRVERCGRGGHAHGGELGLDAFDSHA